jgi:hypothetical protein
VYILSEAYVHNARRSRQWVKSSVNYFRPQSA